ncbi:MAG: hypothetical protein EA381_16885 [Planctomycetaceae bacterium]|nr:MAG: hypothetical protein EA381_16885 [Planctomycetaceae bacterium]
MNPLQNTFEELTTGRAVQPETVASFRLVSTLEPETCQRIAAFIQKMERFAGETLYAFVAETLQQGTGSASDAAKIMNVILNINADSVGPMMEQFSDWAGSHEERRRIFDDAAISRLRSNLETLTGPRQAIATLKKAEDLVRSVGNELQTIRFVCDLRPIFDEDHIRILSLSQVANLKVMYVKQTGDRDCFELVLTKGELQQFRDLADDAIKKMAVLESASLSVAGDQEKPQS